MKPEPGHTQTELTDASKAEIRLILKRDRIYNQTREDLYCNSRYDGFFSHFEDESVREFIDAYARRKADYLVYGDQHLHDAEKNQLYFRQLAERYFWEIQQKKLFDLQCLWRAGQAELPGIEVTRDFLLEELAIHRSVLVPPVTREELGIYRDYLHSPSYAAGDHRHHWQDYDHIRSGWDGSAPTVPAWYAFYDEAIGSGDLLALDDLKGEEELRCLREGLEAGLPATTAAADDKPVLRADYKTLEFFITTFESKAVLRYFDVFEKDHPDISDAERLEEALYILRSGGDTVPISAAPDWKAALLHAADRYRRKRIAMAMNSVFDEYELRRKAGLSFGDDTDPAMLDLLRRKIRSYREAVQRGRDRLGRTRHTG